MQRLEINQTQLAALMHVTPSQVNRLIHGHRRINAAIADKLAPIFGTSPEYWLSLQSRYDLALRRQAGSPDGSSAALGQNPDPNRPAGPPPATPRPRPPERGLAPARQPPSPKRRESGSQEQ